jgi:hypothetical protein
MKASSPSFYEFYSVFFALSFFSFDDFLFRVLTVTFVAKAALKLMLSSWAALAVALTAYSSPFRMESLMSLGFFSLEKSLFNFLSALPLALREL